MTKDCGRQFKVSSNQTFLIHL